MGDDKSEKWRGYTSFFKNNTNRDKFVNNPLPFCINLCFAKAQLSMQNGRGGAL